MFPLNKTMPASGSKSKFLPVITVVTSPFSAVVSKKVPVMLNLACSPLRVFVAVTSRPGEVMIRLPSGCVINFPLPLRSSCRGKAQGRRSAPGTTVKSALTGSGAVPLTDRANTVGAAMSQRQDDANGYHYCSFHSVLPPIYFVVCIHSHLGEKGHLRCGFDTRFSPFDASLSAGSWLGSGPTSRGRQVAVLPFTWRHSDGHVANAAFSSFFSCNPSFTFGAASFCLWVAG